MAFATVDFSPYGVHVQDPNSVSDAELKDVAHKVRIALETTTTMYIVNHGIPQQLIQNCFDSTKRFFEQATETKRKYAYESGLVHGWVAPGQEDVDLSKPFDDKEGYLYKLPKSPDGKVLTERVTPSEEDVPGLRSNMNELFYCGAEFTKRFLDVLALGLELGRDFFSKHLGRPDTLDSYYCLRANWYPPAHSKSEVRFGKHSDFGIITFLFQNGPGLEIYDREADKWIAALPLDGACVVNVGLLLQRWTSDRLLSTIHRVVIPETEEERSRSRQSLVIFGNSEDTVITCADNKYPPVSTKEYIDSLMSATFHY